MAQDEKAEREKDDPRARQQYIEELRGSDTGIPPGVRMKALREMDEMIRQEGQRYWRTRGRDAVQPEESASGSEPPTSILSGAAYEDAIAGGSTSTGQWLFIGPRPTNDSVNSSGRTTAIVVDPNDATGNTAYIGGAQGGVWKTTDGGTNWTPLTDSQPSLAIGSMAIDGSTNPSTVYVGTGEQGFAFDSYYGAGVLKSSDGGTTWTQLGADKFAGPIAGCGSSGTICGGAFIGGLSVKPGGGNPATILAAVSISTAFSNQPGIYRSTDGGTTWTNVQLANTNLGATAVQYATANIAYAGLDGLGVYKSTDGGATWNPRNGTGPSNTITPAGRVELSVALSDATGNTVYASVGDANSGSNLNGFYKTTDGGATWIKLGPTSAPGLNNYCSGQCWYYNVVAVNPVNANVVFVGGSAVSGHVSKTVDGGTTWAAATSSIHVDHHAAAFSADGSKLYWGNDGGVYRTTDTGTGNTSATWQNLNTTLGITQFYSYFALHPTDINITLGGTQDNGTQRYDGTLSIGSAWQRVTCGDGAGNVIDQNNPSIVYANCQNVDVRKSANGGFSGFGLNNSAGNGINTGDSVTFIPPMVGDGNTSAQNFIYFGTNRVYQTRDAAVSWQAVSSDLTNAGSTISNMAVAPSDRSVMYVVTRNGLVWKGTGLTTAAPNDCATLLNCFTNVTGNLAPASRRINAVAVSPSDANTVYVGHSGFGSTSQHLSKSTTGGTTWTNVTGNLPNTPVNDIVVDPDIPGTLYVGTDIGVFRSTDDGTTWATLANGLPRVAVYGLKLHRVSRTLRAATHGRGFWDLSVPVNITGPGGIFSPTSLSFTSRPLNSTSAAQNIAFQNNGTAPTTVSNVSVSGDFALSSNGCTSAVAVSGSCNIGITFTPTAAGSRTGTLTVTSNAVNSPATAGLSGLGAPPNDNFVNAVIVNSGTFTHSTNTLGATEEGTDPTGSCDFSSPTHAKSVWYSYTPATSGQATINTRTSTYDTVLAVFTGTTGSFQEVLNGCNDDINNVPESPSEVIINVTGNTTYRIMVSGFSPNDGGALNFAVTGPAPGSTSSLSYSTTSLTFPTQAVGFAGTPQGVVVTAVGGTVSNLSVGTASGDFSRTHNCPASLTQGASCNVNVTFTPTQQGTRNGSILITSGTSDSQSITLTGTGDTLAVSPATLTMSAVVGRSSAPQVVTFYNSSGSTQLMSNSSVTGDYILTDGCGGANVTNGNTCFVSVALLPSTTGARNGTLTITSGAGSRSVTLNGTGLNFTLALTRPLRPLRGSNGTDIVIEPGQSATMDMQVGVEGGNDELVSFACSGAPNGLSCAVEPRQVRLGSGAQSVKVRISAPSRAGRLGGGSSQIQVLTVSATMLGVTRTQQITVETTGSAAPSPSRTRPRRLSR